MSQIISFQSDKQKAVPTWLPDQPAGADPHDQRSTFKITIKVVDDDNKPASLPLMIGTSEPPETILYYDSDYDPIKVDAESFIHVTTWNNGELIIYLCSRYDVLFTLLARIEEPSQPFRVMHLLFFDFGLAPANLLPPNLARANNQVAIPAWRSLQYAAIADTSLSTGNYSMAAIVCNDFATIGDPTMISNNFKIPYMEMLTRGRQNRLAYVLLAGNNTISSPVVTFTATGQGLVMPAPDKGDTTYLPPQWENGPSTQLTTYDIGSELVLNLTLIDDVQEGDTYEVHIYLNGYDKAGVMMPRAPVQVYTVTAPAGARAGQQIPCRIASEHLIGYQQRSASEWGYMWADCRITNAAWGYATVWTPPWGPIRIDFF